MTILIISRGLPDEKNPMNGIFEFDQAKALSGIGLKVAYFAIDFRAIWHKRKLGAYHCIKDGVACYGMNIPTGPIPIKLRLLIGQLCVSYLFEKYFKGTRENYILHSHFFSNGYMAKRLKNKYRFPLVVTEHLSELTEKNPPEHIVYYARQAYRCADQVLAVSQALADCIYRRTKTRCKVIHNVIDLDVFFKVEKEGHKGFVFASCGELTRRKGYDLLIEAFREFHASHPDARLIIIGGGGQKKELETEIRRMRVQSCVKLVGRKTRKQMCGIYKKCDAFVLPSRNETFGVAYLEAVAAGLPIIATKCGGTDEFVNADNGLLIPVDDTEKLVDAMEQMYKGYRSYHIARMRENLVKRFSPDVIAHQLKDIYQALL